MAFYHYIIPYTLHFISIILSLAMIIFLLAKGRKTPLVFSYIWCISLVFIWSLGYILELNSTSKLGKLLSLSIQYLPISFIGISWCLFCLIYTSNKIVFKRKFIYCLFAIQSALYLIRTVEYISAIFWLNVFFNYSYILLGTYTLIIYITKKKGVLKMQAVFLLSATLVPIIANLHTLIIRAFRINPFNIYLDLTPVSFSFALLFFSIAIFRYKFMNISVIAYKKIVSNLDSAIIVVDNLDKITNYNFAFKKVFGNIFSIENNRVRSFAKALRKHSVLNDNTKNLIHSFEGILDNNISGELTLINNNTYTVNIQIITDKRNYYIGKIIAFHDITTYKSLLQEIEHKNIQLSSLNTQLIKYNENIEELTIAKERNRFAKDLHDTLGHTMSSLIRLLEVLAIKAKAEPSSVLENIDNAINISRNGLKELRKSILGLSYQEINNENINSHIIDMISYFKSLGTEIDFTMSGNFKQLDNHQIKIIFRIIQESVTNSIKHGKASSINIILKINDNIKLFIIDNGKGCDIIKAGFGLTSMSERIKSVGGTLVYGSYGMSGFNIIAKIPLFVSNG